MVKSRAQRRYRRRFHRSRRFRHRGRAITKKIKRVVSRMSETKINALALATHWNSCGVNWIERDISTLAEGTGDVQRIGSKYQFLGFKLWGTLQGAQGTAYLQDVYNQFRIVCTVWTGSCGDTPLSSGVTTLDAPLSRDRRYDAGMDPVYWKQNGRRKLCDKFYILRTMGLADNDPASVHYLPALKRVHIRVRLRKPITICMGAGGTTYPSLRIFLAMRSDSTFVPNPGFINGYIQTFYRDI